ncbi:MAG: BTAD domain-containing putative transcriptional regulator [Paracoccaceae bacterium]
MALLSKIEICLFGSLDFKIDGVSQHLGLSGATRSLLQYLLCFHDRPARRDLLVELFWPGARLDRRRSALNSAVWRIRKALQPFAPISVEATTQSVQLKISDPRALEIDCALLAERIRAASLAAPDDDAAMTGLAETLERCEGAPLDGQDDEWAVIERERLSSLRLRGLTMAMRANAERRRYDDALEFGRRILAIDTFRECALREVMCLCMLAGQRARAVQIFREFETAIEAELGIRPMAETLELYDHLANDRIPQRIPARGLRGEVESCAPAGLTERLSSIENSRRALYHSMRSATI